MGESAGEPRGVNQQLGAEALGRGWIGPGAGMGAGPLGALGAQAERPGLFHGTEAAARGSRDPLQTAFQARLVQHDEGADGNPYCDGQYRAGLSQNVLEVFLLRQAASPLEQQGWGE